jgi:hypothetical protein
MEHPLSGIAWRKSTYSGASGNDCIEVGQVWRKSSYSGTDAGNCVEVGQSWRKSTYSGASGNDCVEVGQSSDVLVRDTTNREGLALAFPASAWHAFTATLR